VRRVAVSLVVLALLIGTVAAFAMTEALKLERRPVVVRAVSRAFSPTCGCPTETARLSFRLRKADRLDLVIVRGRKPVRTLEHNVRHPGGRVTIRWDGRNDAGELAPDGPYRLRVTLRKARRRIVLPRTVYLDTRAPELQITSAAPQAFSPDGDGRGDEFTIVYSTDEDAGQSLLVDGKLVLRERLRKAGESSVAWDGRSEGQPAQAGRYRVSLQVSDRAGNVSADSVSVEIRYVRIVPAKRAVRRGESLRFRVLADAERVSWVLRSPSGRTLLSASTGPGPVVVHLPGSISPGPYVLVATATDHSDRAVVHVLKRRR
jgi:hypothetical protein